MVYWLGAIVAVIVAMLSVFLFYQKPKRLDRSLVAYNRFLKELSKAGFSKRAGEGARDFAERIKPKLPQYSANIEDITQAYLEQRYGVKPSMMGLNHLRDLVKRFRI
jgi:hypothetical protein